MAILVVGSVAFDSVQTPFGQVEEALGGAATYFSYAASFFCPVRLVAAVGEDFPQKHVDLLAARPIDLEGLERLSGPTFRWRGRYDFNLNEAQTLETQLGVFANFKPKLPKTYRDSEFVFLANIQPELQLEVARQVSAPKLIAADTMNFWIEGAREALLETLKVVDILIINEGETRELGDSSSLVRAARQILTFGPKTLVVKRGEYGVLMFHQDEIFSAPAYPLEEVFDPTGAGDTFAGGFMGYLAGTGRSDAAALRQAVLFGATMASFNVGEFSLEGLKRLTTGDIAERYESFRSLVAVEEIDPAASLQVLGPAGSKNGLQV